jgi:hypothetical protein
MFGIGRERAKSAAAAEGQLLARYRDRRPSIGSKDGSGWKEDVSVLRAPGGVRAT